MKILYEQDDRISYPWDEDYSAEEREEDKDDEELPQNFWRKFNRGIIYKKVSRMQLY